MKTSGREKYEGTIRESTNFGKYFVVEYRNKHDIHVCFLDTGYETSVTLAQMRCGSLRDRWLPTIYGVGIIGDEVCYVNNKASYDYVVWKDMLDRVYSKKNHAHTRYSKCSISENFKMFPFFREWCKNQKGFGVFDENCKPFSLDKDLLSDKDAKIYSEDTCVFIPNAVNVCVINSQASRGDLPVGVSRCGNRYTARLSTYGKSTYLGIFASPEEAFYSYKQAKEAYVREVAESFKNQMDSRAYVALMNYTTDIND